MQKLIGLVRRCVEDYKMIEKGDRIAVGVSGGRISISATYTSQIATVVLLLKRGFAKNNDAPIWLSGVSRKNISCPRESIILQHLPVN